MLLRDYIRLRAVTSSFRKELPVSEPNHHESHSVKVTVFAPSVVEPKEFTWPKTEETGVAAAQAAHAFHVHPEAPTFQLGKKVLDRQKTLHADGVKSGDCLELVSAGGGV
jgi:hypothetical protein